MRLCVMCVLFVASSAIACGDITDAGPLDAAMLDGSGRDGAPADGASPDGAADAAVAACVIDFDSNCNVGAPGVCNTTWIGGTGCAQPPDACRSSGTTAFESRSQITIDMAGGEVRFLSVYFVHQGATASGTMTFLNAAGDQLGTPFVTNADCTSVAGSIQAQTFSEPVTSVEINVTSGTIFIDDFGRD